MPRTGRIGAPQALVTSRAARAPMALPVRPSRVAVARRVAVLAAALPAADRSNPVAAGLLVALAEATALGESIARSSPAMGRSWRGRRTRP